MKLTELPPHVRETLALQAILMQLGYDQDVLFVVLNKDALGMAILKDGVHHAFPSAVRPPGLGNDDLIAEWKLACEAWNASPQGDRHLLTESSEVRKRAVPLMAKLSSLGLLPPPVTKIDFECPFCDQHVVTDGDSISVAHTLPLCSKFRETNPLEFLKQCRRRTAGN